MVRSLAENQQMMITPNKTGEMMKKLILLWILLAAVALTGCFGDEEEATGEPGEDGPVLPVSTPSKSGSDGLEDGDEPGSDGYPGPPEEPGYPAPSLPTAISPGYPAPSPVATLDSYPGGFAIFTQPAGLQCEDPTFANMDAAVAQLEEAGIEVLKISRVDLMVCEACGCPTSEQFRVSIDPADVAAALLLGWQRTYQ
jgi:hypothetical protein